MSKPESLADFLGIDPTTATPIAEADVDLSALTIEEFCKRVLSSPEYRRSVYLRVTAGALPAAIETLMYHYAAGKPVERHEHTGKDGAPIQKVTKIIREFVDPHGHPVPLAANALDDMPQGWKTVTH